MSKVRRAPAKYSASCQAVEEGVVAGLLAGIQAGHGVRHRPARCRSSAGAETS